MGRYLLFAYDYYYPIGGWNDFVGHFSTVGEAMAYFEENQSKYSSGHIVDSRNGVIVYTRTEG